MLEGAELKAVFLLMWQETGGLTAAAESVNLTECSQSAPSFKGAHPALLSRLRTHLMSQTAH